MRDLGAHFILDKFDDLKRNVFQVTKFCLKGVIFESFEKFL